jgi:FkbM family methyltransferase
MSYDSIKRRMKPLFNKLSGRLPLCPWRSVLFSLDPRTLRAFPPARTIDIVEEHQGFRRLRFDHQHDFWFPNETLISEELWSEYLAVFWTHRNNAHRYIRKHTEVKAGDICIDCGACEGFFAKQALEAQAARVICIEPNKIMAQCLRQTFKREVAANRVDVINAAAGAVNGTAAFAFDVLNPFGGRIDPDAAPENQVRISTLDSILRELAVDHVDFIKMDIEGGEVQAVEGAVSILKQHRPKLAITTYHRSFDYAVLRSMLVAIGYRKIRAEGITARGANSSEFRPVLLRAWA